MPMLRNRRTGLLALVALMALGASVGVDAATVNLRNNCSYTVYPGIFPAGLFSNGGWSMAPGASVTFNISGSGRLWGRTGCNGASPAQCTTGQCGGVGLQCAGTTGVPNTSLFEFTINASGTDWYNVSYVDAIDNTITVTTSNTSCTGPSSCSEAVKTNCPAGLRSGSVCLSPCTRYNTDQFCCRGAFGTPQTCNTSAWTGEAQTYLNNVHTFCPLSYAYAYDEPSGALRTCPTGTAFNVTFCGGGSAPPPPPPPPPPPGNLNGTRQVAPGHALTKRVDSSGNRTTPGNPIIQWVANGSGAQRWVFNNVGVTPSGNYNIALQGGANCLEVAGGGSGNGSRIQLWPCNGSAAQSWRAVSVPGTGRFTLRPAHSPNRCLDVPGRSTADGVQLQIWDCHSGTNQQWQIQ